MGCNSSTPSTFDATSTNATGGKQENGDTNAELDQVIAELTEMKDRVLPASDIVLTSVVDSSNQSTTTTANDVHIIDLESESAFESIPSEKSQTREIAVPSIETQKEHTADRHPSPDSQSEDAKIEEVETIMEDMEGEETAASEMLPVDTGQGEDIQNDESHLEQRATRWEALADVAAELPPKMTVDPLTGQIYSLSKRD